jgi:hypothetical protein
MEVEDPLRRMITSAALAAGLAIGGVGLARPASAAQTEPGTPSTSNCKGQSIAFAAQVGKNFDPAAPGLGNLARFFGFSVKDVHGLTEESCAGG